MEQKFADKPNFMLSFFQHPEMLMMMIRNRVKLSLMNTRSIKTCQKIFIRHNTDGN